MCGIVGYTGHEQACPIIIDGLKKLEYRVYDSAGVALVTSRGIKVRKKAGRIANLEESIRGERMEGTTGIGHTRWATHGSPNDLNAHPHMSMGGQIAIVHNGIIENYAELREELKKDYGIEFISDTDSEVIAQLIGVLYEGKLEDAVYEAVSRMRGAYTFAAVAADEPEKMVAYRKDTPLIAGIGRDCNFIASDMTALLKYSSDIYLIENDEMVVCTPDKIQIFNKDRKRMDRQVLKVTWSMEDAEKDVMQRPPRDRKESIFSDGLGFDILFQGFVIAAVTVFSFFVGHRMEYGSWAVAESQAGMTMAFLTLSMIEIFHSFNMRSRIASLFTMKKQNGMLWLTLAFSLLITAAVVFIPFLNKTFSFQPISVIQYLIALAMALAVIPIVEVEKTVRRRTLRREAK